MTCVDGGNKSAGVSCGTNMVCDGAGACVPCTAGGACTGNPNVCKNGVYSCATGAMTCADGSNKMGGVSCGTNLVCDGNGNCGACTANQSCTNNPNPCYTGITSCSTGTMVCNNNTQRPVGTACGPNMVCNSAGNCVNCTAGVSCTTNPNQCKVGITQCNTGAQTCVDSGNRPDQTGCNDGQDCTYNDVCKNGACIGTAYSCYPWQCQSSSKCDGAGGCTTTNLPNGTTCGYPDDCTCCSCGSERDLLSLACATIEAAATRRSAAAWPTSTPTSTRAPPRSSACRSALLPIALQAGSMRCCRISTRSSSTSAPTPGGIGVQVADGMLQASPALKPRPSARMKLKLGPSAIARLP